MLALHDALFLLAIHEEKGILISSAADGLKVGLAGAFLAELALQNRVKLGESHKLELVEAPPAAQEEGGETPQETLTGDDLLDGVLVQIKKSGKPRKVEWWVGTLDSDSKKLRKHLMEHLYENRVLVKDESRADWVIPYPGETEQDASAKFALKRRLREIALVCRDAPFEDIVLLSLLQASGLWSLVFLKDERKMAAKNVHKLLFTEALNNPQAQLVEEIVQAVGTLVEEE